MTINDDNWMFLHTATGLSLPFNDMYYRYLRDLGYTGTLQDMIARSGLGLNPSIGEIVYDHVIEDQASLDSLVITSGMYIGVQRGIVVRGGINVGTASNVTIETTGSGADPLFLGSIQHTSGWTNVTGTIWQKDIGYTALNCFTISGAIGSEVVTKFILGTFGSLTSGQFGVSGNILQINSATDPNTLTIEVPINGSLNTATGYYSTGSNNEVSGLRFWFFGFNGFELAGSGVGTQILACDFSYNSNDGGGAHESTSGWLVEDCVIRRNGQQRGLSTAPGDGFSAHDTTSGTVRACLIIDNEKEAFGHQPSASVVMEFNWLENNYQELVILSTGGVGVVKGVFDFYYNVVVFVPQGQASGNGAVFISNSTQKPIVRVNNNTLFCSGTAGAGHCGLRMGGNEVTFKNNIVKGFNRAIDFRATDNANGTLDNDYNCLHGNGSNYFNNSTPGAGGVAAGANDVLADPLFVDAANDNFTLQTGSPCLNEGVDLGFTRDYAGNPVPYGAAPDIGAFERQAA